MPALELSRRTRLSRERLSWFGLQSPAQLSRDNALSAQERAAVIHAGLLSLDGENDPVEQGDVAEAWRDEIRERLADVVNGDVELGTFEQTQERFAARY